VIISLAGAAPAVHDYHSGRIGSFAETLAAIAAAVADHRAVEVETPITRSSYRTLSELPSFLQHHRVARWCLRIVTVDEFATEPATHWVPRLAMAMPFVLHAVVRAERLGLAVAVVDAPLCLLGQYQRHSIARTTRSHPAPCDRCRLRDRCVGIDPRYAERFGTGELSPRNPP
jgi:hypothetical protein